MGKKRSSNKPSKAGQSSRTAANKAKHKKQMEEQYIKAHGSTEGMPDWSKPADYTPKKERVALRKSK